jgi:hypothetical protein
MHSNLSTVSNDDVAVRQLSSLLSDPNSANSNFVKYPDDFDLYALGTVNLSDGSLQSFPQPKLVSTFSAIVALLNAKVGIDSVV